MQSSAKHWFVDSTIPSTLVMHMYTAFLYSQLNITAILLGAYGLLIILCCGQVVLQAREEQKKVVAEYGEELTPESLGSMVYLNAIIQETMRVNPTFNIFVRDCVKTFEINGYRYSENWLLLLNASIVLSRKGVLCILLEVLMHTAHNRQGS